MTDYTPSGLPNVGRARSLDLRSEFADRIAPAINSKINIASGAFTGTPTAPTASVGASGNQIATLDFVIATSFSTNLPGQTSNNGKVIVTDGSNASWTDTFTIPWTFDSTITANDTVTLTDVINTARATVASHATTADIWGAAGNEIDFTGSETITDFPDAPQAGVSRVLHIAGAPTFTHNANIFMPNDSNYTAEAGDIVIVHAITTSTFRIAIHQTNALVVRRKPVFSSDTVDKTAVTSSDDIAATSYSTGLASGTINVVFGDGLFVAYTSASSGFVATSPDGEIWTLRAMPSSAAWRVGFSNSKFLASAGGATTMASSPDGITWSAATSLPGNAQANTSNAPVGIGDTWILHGSSTTAYRSIDAGANWGSVTLPLLNSGGWFMVSGSNFIYASTTINTYVSSTGDTGSWSADAVPSGGVAIKIWKNPNGSIGVDATDGINQSNDGVTWSVVVPQYLSERTEYNQHFFYINGVTGVWSTTSGYSYTFHGITPVLRTSTRNVSQDNRISAEDGSGISVIGADSGYVIKVSDSLTSLFIL
ncbi:MAG: hypothetical protein H6937_02470 [Burkholderiales bacterium]|nr:hypothetical protein [Burkholderiales bacterium]